jgi:hypothetical protein
VTELAHASFMEAIFAVSTIAALADNDDLYDDTNFRISALVGCQAAIRGNCEAGFSV